MTRHRSTTCSTTCSAAAFGAATSTLLLAVGLAGAAAAQSSVESGVTVERNWAVLVDSEGGLNSSATRRSNAAAAEAALYSPDGRFIAAATKGDATVRLLNAADGSEVWATASNNPDEIEAVAYSADGRFIFSGGDQTLRVYDATDGTILRTLESPGAGFESLELSPDGTRLAGGNVNGEVRIYDVSGTNPAAFSRTAVLESSTGADGRADVNQIDWLDNGNLVTANRDQQVRQINSVSGQVVRTYSGVDTSVKAVRLSPDQSIIAGGGGLENQFIGVALWDTQSGDLLRTLTPGAELDSDLVRVEAVEFTPDGQYLLVGGTDPFDDVDVSIEVFSIAELLTSGDSLVSPVASASEPLGWRTEFFSFDPTFDATGSTFNFATAHDDGSVRNWTITVPEPAGAALLLGLAGPLVLRRQR